MDKSKEMSQARKGISKLDDDYKKALKALGFQQNLDEKSLPGPYAQANFKPYLVTIG